MNETYFINDKLRLRSPERTDFKFALPWYSDLEVLWFSERESTAYSMEKIEKMYLDLSKDSLFFIEVKNDGKWTPIGDACLGAKRMPITIGQKDFRGVGISYLVGMKLLEIAKEKGIKSDELFGIYSDNIRALNLYKKLGFYEFGSSGELIKLRIEL